MKKLAKKTVFHKRIAKQKFYDELEISPTIKKSFINEIKAIYWENKISEATANIKTGEEVNEIQLFLIKLNQQSLNEKVLLQIDRQIPYHILFVLQYKDLYQAAIGYKEESDAGRNAFKVSSYYYTDWMKDEDLSIEVNGLDMDAVYENLLRDIGGERLAIKNQESIEASIKRDEQIQKLTKQIEKLTNKKRKTKQFNKQVKISDEIRKLKKELEKLQ